MSRRLKIGQRSWPCRSFILWRNCRKGARGGTAAVLGKQLLRSATSIGANYRAACRAKSTADMIAKLAIVEEEADETLYWLELLAETSILPPETLRPLWAETNELLSMTVTSTKTLRRKK